MVKALKDHKIAPRIKIEERNNISFAVSCRHCEDPLCVKGCILSCPYGALSHSEQGAIQKCELFQKNDFGQPMCVQGCPNKAIVYEER